jgi:hypothetical protein
MIAYNKGWLANSRVQKAAEKDLKEGSVTAAEFAAIVQKYPVGFYSPTILARVGLFILTFIIVVFAVAMLMLMTAGSKIMDGFGFFLFLGGLSYFSLEAIVQTKFHLRSGVDDALKIISGCLFIVALYMLFLKNGAGYDDLGMALIVFIISFGIVIRFADMLASATCAVFFFAIILYAYYASMKTVSFGLTTAPFIIIAVSGFVYWLVCYNQNKKELINYQNSLTIVKLVSLLTLYAAGNYYVVHPLESGLKGVPDPEYAGIPFGAFFWIWTMVIPLVYIGFGIKRKNALLLRLGLLLVAASVFTFRNYYHVLPTDIMLTIAGAVLLGLVYGIMKYLKTPKHGFTYAEPDELNPMDKIQVESLIVAENFSHAPSAPANDGVKFGGGDFGGGGSSAKF